MLPESRAFTDILPREQFLKQTWEPLYEYFAPVALDHLALIFIVLACGALVDASRESQDPETDRFYQLARGIMAVSPALNPPTILDVQIQVRKLLFS